MSAVRRWRRLPSVLVGLLGMVLLGTGLVVAHDLVASSRSMEQEVTRTEALILSNVRTLSETQREILRLQHALDVDAAPAAVRLQMGFVTQRAHESALSYQQTTLGSSALHATARADETRWLEEILPAVRTALRGGPGAAAALRTAEAGLAELELSYNYLASQGEINRRSQISTTNRTASELSTDLRHTLLLLAILVGGGAAALLLGIVLFVRVDRRRERAVRELRDLNEDLSFYSRIVHATDSALVASDRDGRITWVNDAFERATGWTESDIVGKRPGEFLSGPATDPAAVAQINGAVARGEQCRVEIAQYTATGREYWIACDVSPLLNADGRPEGFFAVQTDITERYEAEHLLRAAQQAAELAVQQKSAFLATMSHEIRTPLNAVLGLTDLLLLTGLDAEQRDYVETAHRSGSHLLELINDVLDFSALESGRLEIAHQAISVPQLLRDTVAMLAGQAEARGISLHLHTADDVPDSVRGDQTRLRQVLVNVIGNAIKFTSHGSVTVECRATVVDDVARIVTKVTDTGIGIPEWKIPELFQSFVRGDVSTTREYGGTGLGLAITRGLLRAMDGDVSLTSELGTGTTVTIVTEHPVEVALPANVHRLERHRGPAGGFADLAVLVAEDDPVNRKVILGMLGRLGIDPVVVTNGRDALEQVVAGSYDVVLMDVEMPVMDGLCAVQRIRDAEPDQVPHFIALTANALSGDRERFLDAGMDDYLSKPVTLQTLTSALGRAQLLSA